MNKSFLWPSVLLLLFNAIRTESATAQAGSTAASNVHVVSDSFSIPQLNRTRKIWIYLPPDYDTSSKYYPVIYMHDAQNLFDDSIAFGGTEWKVDESLNQLFSGGDRGCIVVGIENSDQRINEYSPWVNSTVMNAAEGNNYLLFIIQTLKPFIDSKYRTLTDRLHTGMIGSSMGGLITFYGAIMYPNTFAKAGILSPSISFSEGEMDATVQAQGKKAAMRLYLYAGTGESGSVESDVNTSYDVILANGFDTSDVTKVILAGGLHNESTWGQVFPDCYQWLRMNEGNLLNQFKGPSDRLNMKLYPNPTHVSGGFVIHLPTGTDCKTVISGIDGKSIDSYYTCTNNASEVYISTSHLKPGIYLVTIIGKGETLTQKIQIIE